MATGKVKWFNNAKGYGFILPAEGGEDLFAHYSSIQMEGYKTLKAGQDVEFEILEGPKGSHAVNIRADTDSVSPVQTDTESDDANAVPASAAEPAAAKSEAGAAETQPEPAARKSSEFASS